MRRGSKFTLILVLTTVVVITTVDFTFKIITGSQNFPTSQRCFISPDTKEAYKRSPCLGSKPGQVEDLLCLYRKNFLPNYKNPCWRSEDGTIRCLPYFHLIGSDKCGSTDLFNRITNHPDVEKCSCVIGKESWYWSWTRYGIYLKGMNPQYVRNFSEYLDMFKTASGKIQSSSVNGYHEKVVGDGTPMDFWDFRGWRMIPQNSGLSEPLVLTPHLMRHVYGNMKFLLIFRNPVDRLYSDYFFLKYGNSSVSFHRDALASVQIMTDCLRNMTVRQCFFSPEIYYKLPSRIHIGCYSVFLKEWLSVFPRESFLILRTEDYKVSTKRTLGEVFNFLNLTALSKETMTHISDLGHKHETASKKNAEPMLEETRNLLNDFYHKYNAELAEIIGDNRFLWQS